MEKPNVIIQNWPGGISTLAGGTRTAIKIDRPWQMPLSINPATCPFEPQRLKDEKREIVRSSPDGRWVSFNNRFTPNLDHSLVVPVTCADWPDSRVRLLGGKEEIATALDLVYQNIAMQPTREFRQVTINIGWCGGQNVGHIHWHTFGLPPEAWRSLPHHIAVSLEETKYPALTLFEQDGLRVIAGGHRAGQCFILPNGKVDVEDVAMVIDRIVTLYADKFTSRVGARLAPDFTIGLVYDGKKFEYGTYVPVLNHWGSTEYLALLGQQAVTLPWSHGMTAAYLRGEIDL